MLHDHIILCGLGKVGFSILELLHSLRERVVVITLDVQADWLRHAEAMATRIIQTDARSEDILQEAGLESARAIIIATNDDLANIEIALNARHLSESVAIVLRLFDLHLADRLKRDLHMRAVLNSADLSAPAFVAAALGDEFLRTFDIENTYVNIAALQVRSPMTGEGETLREFAARYGVIPLAVRASESHHMLAPSMNSVLAVGDEVVVAAPPTSISRLHLKDHHQAMHAPPFSPRPSRRFRRKRHWTRKRIHPITFLKRIWSLTTPAVRVVLVALLFIAMLGVTVFHYALDLSWVDAIYFTATILTTVGFGDIHLLESPAWLKLFGCVMMLSGVLLMIVVYSIIATYVVTQRFEEVLGHQHTTLSGHIVVVGLGNLGYRVVSRLHELGESVLAIAREGESTFVNLLSKDIPILIGDISQPHLLEAAGVERARALVAVTDDDLVNLRAAQAAETLHPHIRTVVRLFHSSLARKLGPTVFGIDQALNPSQTAAATFVACALAPNVLQGFILGDRLIMLRWLENERTRPCAHRKVGELREQYGVLILLRRPAGERQLCEVKPEDVIQEGDQLVVLEEYSTVARKPAPCSLILFEEPVPSV